MNEADLPHAARDTPPDEASQKLTPVAMQGLLGAACSMATRELRSWEPPSVEALQRALPQHEISAFIARGGMGAVYKGMQRSLKRAVAIKVLPPDLVDEELHYAERFKQEAQAMARLNHPNIVAVYEAGEVVIEDQRAEVGSQMPGMSDEGLARAAPASISHSSSHIGRAAGRRLFYFVMEYVEGTDVAQLLASEGHIDPMRAVQITCAVCEALAFAHGEGIIHRDIKPSNVMIDKKGSVKVADFGLAKTVNVDSSFLTGTKVALGTPDFIAPEALTSGALVDQRADIYAVGVMLYQMLTGKVPRGRFESPSALSPDVDKRLDAVVDRALQTDREKRYSTAGELKRDVECVSRSASVAVSNGKLDQAGLPPVPKNILLAIGALVVTMLGLAWWHAGRAVREPQLGDVQAPLLSWSPMPADGEWKQAISNSLGMKFVPVPGTEVLFCIHETRNSDYAVYAAENPGVDGSWRHPERSGAALNTGTDYPVTMVNWDDACAFCRWLSRKEGRKYRLPTDHEWSAAVGLALLETSDESPMAKSNRFGGLYPWGRKWPPPERAGNLADASAQETLHWGKMIPGYNDGYATTAPVMSFPPNPVGLYDLAGNVFEWCEDWHEEAHTFKVGRGGSFENAPEGRDGRWNPAPIGDLLASRRQPGAPGSRNGVFGFRVVMEKQP